MSKDYLDQLAEFVVNTRLENLEESTVTAAKMVVLDTIGAVLAGSRQPENAGLAQLARKLSGPGRASLLGHPGRVQPVFATLVNATAGVALEMDEGNRLGGGHPAIHVIPAALAVGEEQSSDGKAVLESITVAYEVTSRIGTGTRARPDVHSHGTWGTIGAAAAAARLLGFDAAQTRLAMNLAPSMSPANTWTPCLEGATVRNLYPGRSGFQGIMAAYLSQCGFTAVNDGPADLYGSILGQGFDPQAVVQGLGGPGKLRIEQNYFKLHACCLYNHPVLDAVRALKERHGFDAPQVRHIRVAAPPLALTMTNPEPPNMLSAKFSIPYAVAAAIVYDRTDVTAFDSHRLADPEIRRLAHQVEVVADAQMDLRRYDYPAADVTVSLEGGRVISQRVTAHRGDAPNPATREELIGKFGFLAMDSVGEEDIPKIVKAVERLDGLAHIGELNGLLGRS